MGDSKFSIGGTYEWMGRLKIRKVESTQNNGEVASLVYVHGILHHDVEVRAKQSVSD